MKEISEKPIYGMPKFLLLSFICLVLTLLTTANLLVSLTSWRTLHYNELPTAIASVHLEDVTVDTDENKKESLAQYILDNFIKDDRVTAEQIEKILESGDFSTWAGWMVSKYSDYLSDTDGEKPEFPELKEEDVIALIEENADLIYEETGLHFLEPDKEKLLDTLKAPIKQIDRNLVSSLDSGAGGALTRFFLSWRCWTVLGILLMLLLVWEIVIHQRAQKRIGSALQAYSIAGAIPCFAFFLCGTCSTLLLNMVDMPFLKDSARAVRGTLTAIGGIGMLVCIALFVAGMTANLVAQQLRIESTEDVVPELDSADSALETEKANVLETVPPSINITPEPIPETEIKVPVFPTITKTDFPEPEIENSFPPPVNLVKHSDNHLPESKEPETQKPVTVRKFCRFCGKPLPIENAFFCNVCGKKQIKLDFKE